ncbi:MAG TPA: class I SAM-dependent methyltransferase [Gemmataceae bacterium]|nr:class I SAM-dependent methyltransferase [Gemmataceae bacterium]
MTSTAAARVENAATRFYRRFTRGLRRLVPFLHRPTSAIQARFHYNPEVVDMGDEGGDRVRGIFSPRYDPAVVRQYIQPQFLEYAETYSTKYDHFDFHKWLLTTAFSRLNLDGPKSKGLKILDIGSGSGNTIIPLLELCPDAEVLGTDLSLEIMVLLKQALLGKGLARQCYLLQLNAEELDFQSGTFDLVVGAAILHHLLCPELAIAGCAKILKKGGQAIFFEPFQEGFVELRDAYLDILNHPSADSLTPQARHFFQAMINDINVRLGTDKSAPIYRQLDDKWLFPRAYFEELARKHGFAGCTIYTLHENDSQLEKETEVLVKLAIQQPREGVPDWAWDILKKHDDAIPKDKKPDCLLEACVMFHN